MLAVLRVCPWGWLRCLTHWFAHRRLIFVFNVRSSVRATLTPLLAMTSSEGCPVLCLPCSVVCMCECYVWTQWQWPGSVYFKGKEALYVCMGDVSGKPEANGLLRRCKSWF